MKSQELDLFRTVITQHLGLRFEDSKLDELDAALVARMKAISCSTADAYFRILATSREEQHALATHLTVPETFFFRMPDHFRALMEAVLPEILGRQNSQRIRMLSAGCASGEEAYSLAMLVHDHPGLSGYGVTIRGVDINPEVVAKARQGRYSEWSMRETAPEIQDRHFHKQGRNFQVEETIRQMVSFEEGNLNDPGASFWQKGSFEVIFLRNVLMYFSPDAAKEVIARVAESLVPGGYLFMGSAETLRGVSQEFHLCHTHGAFYYQRRALNGDASGPASAPAANAPPLLPVSVPQIQGDWLETIRLASERIEDLSRKRGKLLKPELSKTRAPIKGFDVSVAIDLMRQERFADALDALPPETTTSADAQLLRAVILANSGRLTEAENACEALLKSDELNAGAHYVMALCREHAGDWRNAGGHDQTAIYLDPSFAMPHLHMGLLAKRSDDSAAARRELYQAILLLEREDASRILLFGGGFSREALVELCQRELKACGGTI